MKKMPAPESVHGGGEPEVLTHLQLREPDVDPIDIAENVGQETTAAGYVSQFCGMRGCGFERQRR